MAPRHQATLVVVAQLLVWVDRLESEERQLAAQRRAEVFRTLVRPRTVRVVRRHLVEARARPEQRPSRASRRSIVPPRSPGAIRTRALVSRALEIGTAEVIIPCFRRLARCAFLVARAALDRSAHRMPLSPRQPVGRASHIAVVPAFVTPRAAAPRQRSRWVAISTAETAKRMPTAWAD